ncbi:MAG: hypothetical protein J3K34DRAFT_279356 [Monoraphidium minutum]|nr:MAG: hypothetical protein J3K34DRAFT_279356 [Monoraphidium minutum]
MGACVSSEAGGAAALSADLRQGSIDCKAIICERPGGAAAPASPSAAAPLCIADARSDAHDGPLETLLKVQGLQNALAAVSEAPGLGLSEAAELLQGELGVDLVSIYGFCSAPGGGGGGDVAVLLAAHGRGASTLERHPVVSDPHWSCLKLRAAGEASLYASAGGGATLPPDWQLLREASRLQSFRAVPIGPPAKPWGVLALASEAPGSLGGARWRVWPGVAAVALVPQVSHWQAAAACRLLRQLDGADDRIVFISLLLQGARSFMDRAVNTATGVRLAVLNPAATKALIFEPAAPGASLSDDGSWARGGGSGRLADVGALVASEMSLSNTLLASAVAIRKARFVRDCTSYMQSSAAPARDLFTRPGQLVSALVVVPLVHGDEAPVAALYVTLEAPSDFAAIRAPLLGFVNSILPMLHLHLRPHIESIWSEAAAVKSHSTRLRTAGAAASAVRRRSAEGLSVSFAADQGLLRLGGGDASASGGFDAGGRRGGGAATRPGGGGSDDEGDSDGYGPCVSTAPSSQLATYHSKRLCTDSMVKALEQEIQKSKRLGAVSFDRPRSCDGGSSSGAASAAAAAAAAAAPCADLVLHEVIGAGGYGTVWRGAYKNVTAAIKVLRSRGGEQEALKDAVEMAVLSAAAHPNVVQAYACLTDMVDVGDDAGAGSDGDAPAARRRRSLGGGARGCAELHAAGAKSAPLPRGLTPGFRPLLSFEDPEDVDACNVIVMEYCDLGTLRDNLRAGIFHRPLAGPPGSPSAGGGGLGVDMAGLLTVALEVAEAVAYLHSIRLAHCDIKLDNVLLKSAPAQPRGYISKLADFGLVKLLGASDAAVNISGAGTASHLAPEIFQAGSQITTAADSYAFGVLLYEAYMGGAHAYQGLTRAVIIERVSRAGMRPRFPRGAPAPYVALAAACWAEAPSQRPAFPQIIAALRAMMQSVTGAAAATAAAAAAAAAASGVRAPCTPQ